MSYRPRHSDAQLAALNDLYDENDHPCIEDRVALAENLGMYVIHPAQVFPSTKYFH